MLYRIDEDRRLRRAGEDWSPKELELERYLVESSTNGYSFLNSSVFGDQLLVLRNQLRTRSDKRADIFALDRLGNGVIIELKRDRARCGVETQALQYLADFSRYRGTAFLREFASKEVSRETILAHVGGNASEEDLNRSSRIILVARSFDDTLRSMGEWLSSKGVGFRLVAYEPVQLHGEKLLSFSVEFDRSPESLYNLGSASSISTIREPAIFWHNIGEADESWWQYLASHGQIAASFDNAPEDQGEKLLNRYMPGDRIVAYATGRGAVGWGMVANPTNYRLLKPGTPDDRLGGSCLHRLNIDWMRIVPLSEGIRADEVRRDFGIYHPISTSVSIDPGNGERLIAAMNQRFPAAAAKLR